MISMHVAEGKDDTLRSWLHDYQARVNRNALIAWHYRTGGDINS